MDNSFNDQELSEIMKEIEALEEDYGTVEDKPVNLVTEELAAAAIEESHSTPVQARTIEDEPVEAIMEEKTSSPVTEEITPSPVTEEATPVTNVVALGHKKSSAEETPTKSAGASTSMNFKVHGNLTLDLQFDIGGKVVCLEVTESGLAIELEGGIRFSVPVDGVSSFKKAV